MTRFEYIWLDKALALRSKVRYEDADLAPEWSFDGSSTGQALGIASDCLLIPVRTYTNPLDGGYFVLCEVYNGLMEPHSTNTRQLLNGYDAEDTDWWFAFEQEYFLMDNDTILGWPKDGTPRPQGDYYCGVGFANTRGRGLVSHHTEMCLEAGLNITGTNAEVALGQWEYQIFSKGHLQAADDLWISRYILYRVAEFYNTDIELHPKPVKGDWNGSGCHINFSNSVLRDESSKKVVEDIIKKLELTHGKVMDGEVYGKYNAERLTGEHETQHYSKFSYGECDRGASIRIPSYTVQNNYHGYLEDRRPASNVDPYQAISHILDTLGDKDE